MRSEGPEGVLRREDVQMTESPVEYGVPPKDQLRQQKVQTRFGETWARLHTAQGNREMINKEVRRLMDGLAFLRIELPCQGVEYQGVVVDRDPEIEEDMPPAPFIQWGEALGVSPDLFASEKGN